VWERLGLPSAVADDVENSEMQRTFRSYLFMRIVPILRDIGLWGPRIQAAFADMGVLGFADADVDAEMATDERAAEEFDRQHTAHVAQAAAAGGPAGGA